MRLGIVSDSHGHIDHTRPAVRMLESLEVDTVLHCGDIGSAEVVAMFAAWPTHFVFGNCDYNHASLAMAIEDAGQQCHGLFGDLDFDGTRIALLHSHEHSRFQAALDNPDYQVVCFGHTHVAEKVRRDGKLVLNPGALYRAARHSIAVLDLPQCEAEIIEL